MKAPASRRRYRRSLSTLEHHPGWPVCRPARLYPERTTSIADVLMRILMLNSDAEGTNRVDKDHEAYIRRLDSFIWRESRADSA